MSFPNGSIAGPNKKFPQIFEDLFSKSNGGTEPNFLKLLTKQINVIGNGKILESLRILLFWLKAYRPRKDGGLRSIAIAETYCF